MRGSSDFDDLPANRHFIDEIVSRKTTAMAPISIRARGVIPAPAGSADQRLRGDYRNRHLDQQLHAEEGVLHRALAVDRPPAAGAAL